MILLIDVGNSRTKWAVYAVGCLSLHGEADNHEIHAGSPLFRGVEPEAIYIASVASAQVNGQFAELCRRLWGRDPIMLRSQRECCGVRNGYVESERLGVDRWAALVAAYRLVSGPVVVIDSGTAMTVDVVDQDGGHLGGWILPGRTLMSQCLLGGTALVRPGEALLQDDKLGCDTAGCVLHGTEAALLGVIEYAWRKMTARLGAVSMVITGGDALTLLPHLPFAVRYERDLVLQGMAAMVESMRTNVTP